MCRYKNLYIIFFIPPMIGKLVSAKLEKFQFYLRFRIFKAFFSLPPCCPSSLIKYLDQRSINNLTSTLICFSGASNCFCRRVLFMWIPNVILVYCYEHHRRRFTQLLMKVTTVQYLHNTSGCTYRNNRHDHFNNRQDN